MYLLCLLTRAKQPNQDRRRFIAKRFMLQKYCFSDSQKSHYLLHFQNMTSQSFEEKNPTFVVRRLIWFMKICFIAIKAVLSRILAFSLKWAPKLKILRIFFWNLLHCYYSLSAKSSYLKYWLNKNTLKQNKYLNKHG